MSNKKLDCVPTSCYTNSVKVVHDMAKDSRQSVSEYHKQLKDMKIRFPKASEELGIPDYSEVIKSQASRLGKSANEYILDLIQEDIRTNESGLNDSEFTIIRDMRMINKLKDSQ